MSVMVTRAIEQSKALLAGWLHAVAVQWPSLECRVECWRGWFGSGSKEVVVVA